MKGSEFFTSPSLLPLITTCTPGGAACYNAERSTADCQCCGKNLGMDYAMPNSIDGNKDKLFDTFGVLSNFKKNCDNPASANNCNTCLLWRKLRGGFPPVMNVTVTCTAADTCFYTRDKKYTLMATNPNFDPGHFLLLPGSDKANWPVTGVEDRQVLKTKLEKIWDLAWRAAYKPYEQLTSVPFRSVPDLPPSDTSCNIGIALNPASARSQHQMHIHIARVPSPVRQLLAGRATNYGTWKKVRIPITRKNEADWPLVYARYFTLPSSKAGPSKFDIFHKAFAFANADWLFLQAWGIMIIPDEEPINLLNEEAPLPRGFYLVLSTNNQYGSWNPFRGGSMENKDYEPEELLCNNWAYGGGEFWTREECGMPPALLGSVESGKWDTLF